MLSILSRLAIHWLVTLALFIVVFTAPYTVDPVRAESYAETPNGFSLVTSNLGIEFYRRNYSGGSPDFVQVVHLDQGASVRLLHGDITNAGTGQGVYGGNDARFVRKSIGQYWGEAASISSAAFCVSNGQFFKMAESPSRLPFSLKRDGQVLTDGYGINEFPNQKLMLEIWHDRVDIRSLSAEALYSSSAPNIVAGLTEDAEKASKKAVGRTFVGVDDRDRNGSSEILLIFNTRTAKPSTAADVLREFGADQVMMLDGGGSTQLICQGNPLIDTERLIPQSLATFAATGPVYTASFPQDPLPKILVGNDRDMLVNVTNTGTAAWPINDTHIQVRIADMGQTYHLALPENIQPGQTVELKFELPVEIQTGTYLADLALLIADQEFSYHPGALQFSKYDFSEQVSQASIGGAGVHASEAQVVENSTLRTEQNLDQGQLDIDFSNIIWVPLVMFPLLGLVIILVMNYQRTFSLYND